MDTTREIFRFYLIQSRKGQNLSQEKLAEMSGLSKQQVYRIEKGQSWPPAETIQRLANALGVSESYLFGGAVKPDEIAKFPEAKPISKDRSDLIAAIVTALPTLNERELNVISGKIEEFMSFKKVNKDSSVG
jgi:transcriptional regulator with XRE-family HTH domain